jgi:four helix bundle protein
MENQAAQSATKVRSFQDPEGWKACRELRRAVFVLVRRFPAEEKRRLCDQMIRASRGATANLAEGYGRYHFQETIQFCRQARGSLYELLDHLTTALDCSYIDGKTFRAFENQTLRCIQLVNGFVRYLRQKRAGSKTKE